MSQENLTVSVSGATVYKAVANYLKNSTTLQDVIAAKVAIVLESGIVSTMVHRLFDEKFSKLQMHEVVTREVQKEVKKQVKNYLNKEVIDTVMQDVIESMSSKIKGKK